MKLDKFRHLRGSIRKADFTTKSNQGQAIRFSVFLFILNKGGYEYAS